MEKIFTLCFHLFLLFISDADPLKIIAGDRSVVKKDGATHTISKYYIVPKNYDPNNTTRNSSVSQKTSLRSLYNKSGGSGPIGGEITKDKVKTVSDQSNSDVVTVGTINTPIKTPIDNKSQLKIEQGEVNQNDGAIESMVSVKAIPILDSHDLETDKKDASHSSELEETQRRVIGEEDVVNDLVTLSAIPVANQETVGNADVLRSQVQIKRDPETEHTVSDTTETAKHIDNLLDSLDPKFTGGVSPGKIIDSRIIKKLTWQNNPRSMERSEIPALTIQDKGSSTSILKDDIPWYIEGEASLSPYIMIEQRQSQKKQWNIDSSEDPAWTIQDKGTSTPKDDIPWYIEDEASLSPYIMIKQRQSQKKQWNIDSSEDPAWTIQDKGTSTPKDDIPWYIEDEASLSPYIMIKQRQSQKKQWNIDSSEDPAWTIQDKGTSIPKDDIPWYIEDEASLSPYIMIKQRQSQKKQWNIDSSEDPAWTIQDNGTSTPKDDIPWYIEDKASFPPHKISQDSAYFGPWNINKGLPTWTSGPGGKLLINPSQIKKNTVHSVKNGIKKPFHIYTYVINPSKITNEVPNAINTQTKLFGLPISSQGEVFYNNQRYYEPQINIGQSSVKNTNYITKQEDNIPLYVVGPGSELKPKPALVLPNSDDVVYFIQQNSHPPATNTASAHSSVQINQPNGLISSSASRTANQPSSFSTASAHSFIKQAPVYEGNYPGLVNPNGVYTDDEPANTNVPNYYDGPTNGNEEVNPGSIFNVQQYPVYPNGVYNNDKPIPAYGQDSNIQPGFISKATAHATYTNVPNYYDVPNNVYEENHVSKNVEVYQNPVYPNVVNEQNYPGYISKDAYSEQILPNTYNIPINEKEIDVTQSSLIKHIPSTEHPKLAPTYHLLTLQNIQKLRNAVIQTIQLYRPRVNNGKALINLNKVLEVILILAESFEETDRINPWYERIFYNSRLNEHPLQPYVYHLIRQRWLHELMLLMYKNNFSVNILQNPGIFSFLETWQIPSYVQIFLETWKATHVSYPNGYNKDTKFITHTFDDVIEDLPKDLEEYVTKSVVDSYKSSNDIVLSIAGVEAEPDASAIIHMLQEYLKHKTVIEKQQNVLIGDNKEEMLRHIVLYLKQKGYDSTTIANLIKKLYSVVYSVEGDCHTHRPDFAKIMYNVIVPVLRRSG